VPIIVGPVVEIVIKKAKAKLSPIARATIGNQVEAAIREAFYECEQEAKTQTIKLPAYHT
jgi:hypothetical protein